MPEARELEGWRVSATTTSKASLVSAWFFASAAMVLATIAALQAWPSWICVLTGFSASLYLNQFGKRYRKYREENDGA